MLTAIIIIVLLSWFGGRALLSSIFASATVDAPTLVSAGMKSAVYATTALQTACESLPKSAEAFTLGVIKDSLEEVQQLKQDFGCTDASVRTTTQLYKWAKDNGLI